MLTTLIDLKDERPCLVTLPPILNLINICKYNLLSHSHASKYIYMKL